MLPCVRDYCRIFKDCDPWSIQLECNLQALPLRIHWMVTERKWKMGAWCNSEYIQSLFCFPVEKCRQFCDVSRPCVYLNSSTDITCRILLCLGVFKRMHVVVHQIYVLLVHARQCREDQTYHNFLYLPWMMLHADNVCRYRRLLLCTLSYPRFSISVVLFQCHEEQ
jgi:hypothetical protein